MSREHQNLSFLYQDHEATVQEGNKFWEEKCPDDVDSGRVCLLPHDFLRENPVKNAEVYLLRYIM